jgi:multisubunit Na+/H+ antiporter MnhG subunit
VAAGIAVKEIPMDNEQIRRIIDDRYDVSREDTIRSMLSEFYSRKMAATAAFIWVIGALFLAAAIYSAVRFFGTPETRYQILYATIFITAFNGMGLMKIFAWQMLHRNSIKREIKRLELRLAEALPSPSKPNR